MKEVLAKGAKKFRLSIPPTGVFPARVPLISFHGLLAQARCPAPFVFGSEDLARQGFAEAIGGRATGVAARDAEERVAARKLLAEVPLKRLVEDLIIPCQENAMPRGLERVRGLRLPVTHILSVQGQGPESIAAWVPCR